MAAMTAGRPAATPAGEAPDVRGPVRPHDRPRGARDAFDFLGMPEGALANKVGAYDPIDDAVVWKCDRLSGLVNRWADGSLAF